jgi:hypothetical protein
MFNKNQPEGDYKRYSKDIYLTKGTGVHCSIKAHPGAMFQKRTAHGRFLELKVQ